MTGQADKLSEKQQNAVYQSWKDRSIPSEIEQKGIFSGFNFDIGNIGPMMRIGLFRKYLYSHDAFKTILIFIFSVVVISCTKTPPKIVDLSFDNSIPGKNADEQTLNSIRKVGKFYTVQYYGDLHVSSLDTCLESNQLTPTNNRT